MWLISIKVFRIVLIIVFMVHFCLFILIVTCLGAPTEGVKGGLKSQ